MKYDFECEQCNKIIELSMSINDYEKMKSPVCCGKKMNRVYSKPLVKIGGNIITGNTYQGIH